MPASQNKTPLKPVTMRDIARAAGVSTPAVSLAMRNSPKISETRRKDILKIAAQMGYRRDPRITELMEHLRAARTHRKHTHIAILVPEISKEKLRVFPRIADIIKGAKEIADKAGFETDVFFLAEPGMTPRRIREILIARGIKGIVVTPYPSGVAKLDFDFTGFSAATTGYSIVEPKLHRACPDYLQMMDELLADAALHGYKRPGLAMTYSEGGVGHKLFTSSFLYYQTLIPAKNRIPILHKSDICPGKISAWIKTHAPDVIISDRFVYQMLLELGYKIPSAIGFASIDISDHPADIDVSGADHRHHLVGCEAMKLVLSSLALNITGIPSTPKIVLADSHQHMGSSLVPQNPLARKAVAKIKAKSPGACSV